MTWVKCHEGLTRGEWRGVPRAVRFVLLELSLACRPLRGSVALPRGMSDLDGVVDMLGGDRREVRDALKILADGAEPTVVIEGDEGRRVLRIPRWGDHNSVDLSTERSKRHREKARESAERNALHDRSQRVGNDDDCNARNAHRQEERREEDPPVVPQGGPPPVLLDVGPAKRPERKKPARGLPPDWKPSEAHYAKALQGGMRADEVDRQAEKFTDYHAAKGSVFADWDAAFRTWLSNAARFDGGRAAEPETHSRAVLAQREQDRVERELRRNGVSLDAIGRGGAR